MKNKEISEKSNNLDNLSLYVTDVLCSANLKGLSVDFAEITLDSILKTRH